MLYLQTEPAIEPEREVPVQSSPIPARKLVRFEEVSKGYRWASPATSLPRLVASWFRRTLHRSKWASAPLSEATSGH